MSDHDLDLLAAALEALDAARDDAPSGAAEKRLGRAAWNHYFEQLDRATIALEAAARAVLAHNGVDLSDQGR